jgi:hypothetical protein
VTCYRKYDYKNDNPDDVKKIFSTINDLKAKFHLKFSNHPECGIIMLLFNRDNFAEFKKELDFSVSKYTSVTKYTCDNDTAEKLKQQKDSFLRLHYDEGMLLFTSRTPLNVHKKLVKRIFKDSEVEFNKFNLVFTQNKNDDSTNNESTNNNESSDGFQTVTHRKPRSATQQASVSVSASQSVSQSQSQPSQSQSQQSQSQPSQSASHQAKPTIRGQSSTRGRGGSVRSYKSVAVADSK